MSETYIYLIILLIALFWVNGGLFGFVQRDNAVLSDENHLLIEYLAKHSTKPKNYRRTPGEFRNNGYTVSGRVEGEKANLSYTFPLLNGSEAKYTVSFIPQEFSSKVSAFGVHNSCFGPVDEKSYQLKSTDPNYLQLHMNKDGFYFNNANDFGIDYNYIISLSQDVGCDIATFIVEQLQQQGYDSYVNRVQAALNFVQFIPYGQPEFDHGNYGYFGFSLPHESMAISYADCDSKSALFACILKQMIKSQNIVLVLCEFKNENLGMHMIVGVSDLPFPGQTIRHQAKNYLLLETTIPIAIHEQQHEYIIHEIIPVN
ncbi:MAG: hypothetical protein LW688_04205 [Cryomorphaceae bacterium]|jgi:hypothetical protein|nr:hypothetical protein [Cryomorphaceae bacterium]